MVKRMLYKADPEAYIFCSEANGVKIHKDKADEFEKGYKYGDISKHPNKMDIMICKGNNRSDTKQFIRIYDVKESGNGVILERDEEKEKGEWSSDKF
jgi:hypothetical protein